MRFIHGASHTQSVHESLSLKSVLIVILELKKSEFTIRKRRFLALRMPR